jgi:hypothetical protein
MTRILVFVVVVSSVLVLDLHRCSVNRPRPRCPLEGSWFMGDVCYNQDLELRGVGYGEWRQGDRHGTEQTIRFRWTKTATTQSLRYDAKVVERLAASPYLKADR